MRHLTDVARRLRVPHRMGGWSAIVFLALYGFFTGRPEFLDIGLTYALLNIVGVFAVLKFFRYGGLGIYAAVAEPRAPGTVGGMRVKVASVKRRDRRDIP